MRHLTSHPKILYGVAIALVSSYMPALADMTPIDDGQLQTITGQSGIALGLELDINVVDINEDGLVDLNGPDFQTIQDCGSGDFTSGVAGTCRLALNFANRPGEWLVLKDYYGSVRIDNLYLDGGHLSDAGNATSSYDPDKFLDSDGSTCLVDPSGNDCGADGVPPAYFDDLAAIVVSMPGSYNGNQFTPTGYDSSNGQSSGYDSLTMGLTIGGMSVEYGVSGYSQNQLGSFIGVKIADNNSPYAGADVQGQAYVFGF